MKCQTILLKQFFGLKGAVYYEAIAMGIFSHVKITCSFHMWRYQVFARKLTWYFIGVYIIISDICSWQCDRWFYIDDGPLFETLPHVIDHYSRCADGLPVLLKTPVPPDSSPPRTTQSIAPPSMRKPPGMRPPTLPLSSAVSTPVLSMSPSKSQVTTRIPLQRAESAVSVLCFNTSSFTPKISQDP